MIDRGSQFTSADYPGRSDLIEKLAPASFGKNKPGSKIASNILLLLFTATLGTAMPCQAAHQTGWHIEQSSEVIGNHVIEFDAESFSIANKETGLDILLDGASGKLFLLDNKRKTYCKLKKQPFAGIAAYHLANLSFGTFYDYRFFKIGNDKVKQFQVVKYGAAEKHPIFEDNKGKTRLTVLMIEPQSFPPELSTIMCYMYAIPRLPGIPLCMSYDQQKTPKGRLTTNAIKQSAALHLTTMPPTSWKEVTNQDELTVRNANMDFSDILGPAPK